MMSRRKPLVLHSLLPGFFDSRSGRAMSPSLVLSHISLHISIHCLLLPHSSPSYVITSNIQRKCNCKSRHCVVPTLRSVDTCYNGRQRKTVSGNDISISLNTISSARSLTIALDGTISSIYLGTISSSLGQSSYANPLRMNC